MVTLLHCCAENQQVIIYFPCAFYFTAFQKNNLEGIYIQVFFKRGLQMKLKVDMRIMILALHKDKISTEYFYLKT